MDYLRQTVDSDELADVFDLPSTLRGRKVEVIILPAVRESVSSLDNGTAFGCLHKYANSAFIVREQGAWEQAVVEKYDRH
jgi:hypothetical protein